VFKGADLGGFRFVVVSLAIAGLSLLTTHGALGNDETFPEPPSWPGFDVDDAPIVVVGSAGKGEPYWSESEGLIWTLTEFNVTEKQRGDNVPDTITIKEVGGQLPNGLSQQSSHPVVFAEGERARLFLEAVPGDTVYRVFGGPEGKQAPCPDEGCTGSPSDSPNVFPATGGPPVDDASAPYFMLAGVLGFVGAAAFVAAARRAGESLE